MKKIKKSLILVAVILLFSGCIEKAAENPKIVKTEDNVTGNQKTVKIGDRVSVDYIASLKGKIIDTSIESIAKENNLSVPNKAYRYKPIVFVIGDGKVIKGFEEDIIGMKVGESKILTIPPEKGYGQIDPQLIQTIPIIQKIPVKRTFVKDFEIPFEEFDSDFGSHKIGDNVQMPGTNVSFTIININSTSNVRISQNLTVGYEITGLAPWKETVIKIDDKNVTVKSEAKKNDIIQLKDFPWNATVVNIDSDNITLRNNGIPDTKIYTRDMNGSRSYMRIHFNDTYIIVDRNNENAGETLVFNVTVRSIN